MQQNLPFAMTENPFDLGSASCSTGRYDLQD